MDYIGKKMDKYMEYIPQRHGEYINFVKFLLKNADEVCFVVNPFLDGLDELKNSIWADLMRSVRYASVAKAVTERYEETKYYLVLKNDYAVYDFFLHKRNIFDFEETDPECKITLEDPLFVRNGEIICYTLTHEYGCDIEENLYWKFKCKSGKN